MVDLKALGKRVEAPKCVDPSVLEFVQIPAIDTVGYECKEFTSRCPVTGQPDYGHISICFYFSNANEGDIELPHYGIETKSLKLYLEGFRDIGMFQEAIVFTVAKDIYEKYPLDGVKLNVNVSAAFNTRGGIGINPCVEFPL
jgi:7-cyano-7-deazaguanine reductase